MNDLAATRHQQKRLLVHNPLHFAVGSLVVLLCTFGLAVSPLNIAARVVGFGAIVVVYMAVCMQFLRAADDGRISRITAENISGCLADLNEVNNAFAGAMSVRDMFRLAMSRVKASVPFEGATLHLKENAEELLVTAAVFEADRPGVDPLGPRDLVRICDQSGRLEFDREGGFVAVPLCREDHVFGVLQFGLSKSIPVTPQTWMELSGRIAPLILSSLAYERSHANALTDATTDLPNEKAFYLILENQMAEVQRDPAARPLAVACVDIKNFEMINQQLGHAAGDRALNLAVEIIRDNLRQMDFFARAANDEFLVILPTASKEIAQEVIARITTAFHGRQLKLDDEVSAEIELNFGWAAFGEDGETAGQLLKAARLKKLQSKNAVSNKVLFFNREMIG